MTSNNKKIKEYDDYMTPAYKATALKAAEEVDQTKSLSEQSKYIYDKLDEAHPEIEWGCQAV